MEALEFLLCKFVSSLCCLFLNVSCDLITVMASYPVDNQVAIYRQCHMKLCNC